jgi:hypothetical protein
MRSVIHTIEQMWIVWLLLSFLFFMSIHRHNRDPGMKEWSKKLRAQFFMQMLGACYVFFFITGVAVASVSRALHFVPAWAGTILMGSAVVVAFFWHPNVEE